MSRNPEFTRNLWLQITPQRLLAVPVILGLIVLVVFAKGDDTPFQSLAWLGAIGFVGVTGFWGAKEAAEAQSDEFSQGTWDSQRGSGLTASQMLFGKLFGGAAFAWYAGFWCLAVYLLGAFYSLPADALLRGVVALLASAMFLHALVLLSTLLGWRKLRQLSARPGRGVGLLFAFLVVPNLATVLIRVVPDDSTVNWYGLSIPSRDFLLASLVLFTGWTLLGAWRVMRAELQFRNGPWCWIGFVLFLQGYVAGFISAPSFADTGNWLNHINLLGLRLLIGSGLALIIAYAFLLTERKDAIDFARLLAHQQAGRWQRAAEHLPIWAVTLLMTLLSLLLGIVAAAAGGAAAKALVSLIVGCTALLLFAVRDVALVLWCNLGGLQRRADAAAFAYLLVLYGLLPLLLLAFDQRWLLGLALPWVSFESPVWVLAAAAWAALGLDLVRRRWQQQVASQ